MKCTRFIERECKISWDFISLNAPLQSGRYHAERVQLKFSAKGKKPRYRHSKDGWIVRYHASIWIGPTTHYHIAGFIGQKELIFTIL